MSTAESSAPANPLNAFRLDGRVAIVTGASSGLGVQFARTLHAVGATVVLAARRLDRLEALVEELPGSIAIATDLSLAEDRERLWANVSAADFLTNSEKRQMLGLDAGLNREGGQ